MTPTDASSPDPSPTGAWRRRAGDWLANGLVLALALWRLGGLLGVAASARLYADECFHADVAEWIAAHHRLPTVMPEFYSGFSYYYPPLLHLLGAVWVAFAGSRSIVELDVWLYAALLAILAWAPVPGLAPRARRWAILLCLANGWLAAYATRFYAEMLISTLVAAAALLAWRLHHTRRVRDAVGLGIVSGLAMLAKHTALVLPLSFVGMAALAQRRHDVAARRAALVAFVIAMALALPYFIRNAVLWGSPVYPALARDTHAVVWRLNLAKFSPAPLAFYRDAFAAIGIPIMAVTAMALALAAVRRRVDPPLVLVLGGLVVLGLGAAVTLHDVRHATPLIAVLAIAACAIVSDALGTRPRVTRAFELGCLTLAVVLVARTSGLRDDIDLPPELERAYAVTRRAAPKGATILSLWTYDTYYYTRVPATWPIPWAQRVHPVALFFEHDPARFDAELRRDGITLILVPRDEPRAAFDGANYPASFLDCVAALVRRGRLRVVWRSEQFALVERVDAAP